MSDGVREAWEAQLKQSAETLQRTEENHKTTVYLAHKAGMTYDEIGKVLGVSSSVIGNWRAEVAQTRDQSRRRSAQQPGE